MVFKTHNIQFQRIDHNVQHPLLLRTKTLPTFVKKTRMTLPPCWGLKAGRRMENVNRSCLTLTQWWPTTNKSKVMWQATLRGTDVIHVMIMMLLMRGNPSSYEERRLRLPIQCYQIRCPWVQTTTATSHCTPGKHVITTRHTSLTTDWPPRSPSRMYSSGSNIDFSINFRWSYLLMI